MKITNKKNSDPIAEARNNKHFKRYSNEANVRIRFANAVYNARLERQMSQQELAKNPEPHKKEYQI
jgi:hypothetical protein